MRKSAHRKRGNETRPRVFTRGYLVRVLQSVLEKAAEPVM